MELNDDESLYGLIPDVSSDDEANKIAWYQYLIFDKYENAAPFYVTYPATLSWEIDSQWLKFQEEYAINPSEAEKSYCKFKAPEPLSHSQGCQSPPRMVGDLLTWKFKDTETGIQYHIKRTTKLIGTLVKHGQIEFVRYHKTNEKEIFLYDRKTGYDDTIDIENEYKELEIGDKVILKHGGIEIMKIN